MTPTERLMLLRIPLPESVAEQYAQQADAKGMAVEDLMAGRLAKAVSHSAARGIYLNDDQRQEIEQMLDRTFRAGDDVVTAVRRSQTIRINSIPITLDATVLDRLKTRHQEGGQFADFVAATVKLLLEQYVGLR